LRIARWALQALQLPGMIDAAMPRIRNARKANAAMLCSGAMPARAGRGEADGLAARSHADDNAVYLLT
jgi:hypothetical protein